MAVTQTRAEFQRVIGGRIRKARRDMPFEHGKRVSQDSFSQKVGVHWVTVSQWERGKQPPSLQHLMRIAEVTGKPVEFFTADEDEEEDPAMGMRRIAADLVLRGQDDLAADLLAQIDRHKSVVESV